MSHVPAPPPGAAVVFVGEEVEFQRETKSVKDQAKHGRKTESNSVKRERVWTVTKTAETRSCTCCGECKTDAVVQVYEYRDGVQVGKHALTPRVDPSSGGQKRFRVKVNGKDLYLHSILAFAFHRSWHCPIVRDYREFRQKGFEGDHLAWVRSGDFALATQPELCYCGWIQAVPRKLHKARSARLKRARKVIERVRKVEKQEADAIAGLELVEANFEALRRKDGPRGKKLKRRMRSLRDVQKRIKKQREEGTKLLEAAWPNAEKFREQIKKQKGLFLSLDGYVSEAGELKQFGGNEFLGALFVDAETTDGRRAWMLQHDKLINAQRRVR